MGLSADQIACARIVEKGDPLRFRAVMAAPPAARAVLFPIYAFNVEVARAPWVSAEPMIAQMRLQWWEDALDEIASGTPVRRHEVTTPLAQALSPPAARRLQRLVTARRLDTERAPFDTAEALRAYLDDTAGLLAVTAAQALGAPDSALTLWITVWGRAAGLARYLQAVPQLEARARLPLPDGRADGVAGLARESLSDLRKLGGFKGLTGLKRRLPGASGAALLEFWQARPLLRQVARDPGRVASGTLGLSPFADRARLMWLAAV